MGQQSIIIAVLASTLLSISAIGFFGKQTESTNTASTQVEQQQAYNVATTGVNLALAKLRKEKTWRSGYSNLSVASGRCNLTVTDIGTDTVRIVSQGLVGTQQHQSIVVAKLSSIFPTVESALTIFGDSVDFSNDGKAFDIDGRDYKNDGTTLGANPAVYGVGVQKTKIVNDINADLKAGKITANVLGKGGTPSVGTFSTTDLVALFNQYKGLATRTASPIISGNTMFGTLSSPEIVYVNGNLDWSGTISGAGILVVNGSIKMSGNISWKGIILTLSGDVQMNLGGSGNPHLIGTTFVGNTTKDQITKVNVTGNPSIKYSYSILQTILANLDLLAIEIISYYE